MEIYVPYVPEMRIPSIREVVEALDGRLLDSRPAEPTPTSSWHANCHGVSLEILRTGILGEPGPELRVVRGAANYRIGGQHSWICVGSPYDPEAIYIDYTAHTWDNGARNVIVTTARQGFEDFEGVDSGRGHAIHGYDPMSIWKFGRPNPGPGKKFSLNTLGLSHQAENFIDTIGPMNADAWVKLCQYPQGAWPYKEVVKAVIAQVPRAQELLPIDIYSMAGDINVKNLYW